MSIQRGIGVVIAVWLISTISVAMAQDFQLQRGGDYLDIRRSVVLLAEEVESLGDSIQKYVSPRDARLLLAQVRQVEEELERLQMSLPRGTEDEVLEIFHGMDAELHRLLAATLVQIRHDAVDWHVQRVIDSDNDLHETLFRSAPAIESDLREAIIAAAYDLEAESLRFSQGILRFAGVGAESRPLRAAASQLVFETDRFQEVAVSDAKFPELRRQFLRVDSDLYGVMKQVHASELTPYFIRQAERIEANCIRLKTLLYAEADSTY